MKSLDRDDDWTFVIKMHGILEAALNHLILTQLGNPALEDVVSELETGNRRTGKLAFLKGFDLLSHDARVFVMVFSKLRNDCVHRVKNFDLNLTTYFAGLNAEQRKNWTTGLLSWCRSPEKITEAQRPMVLSIPRHGIYNACMGIVINCLEHHKAAEDYQELLREFAELRERTQSTPKKP